MVLGAVDGDGVPFHMMSANVGSQPLPDLSGDDWRLIYFTTAELADDSVSGWTADPDRDGNSNAVEFALGTNPRDAASRSDPDRIIVEFSGDDYQALSIARRANHLATVDVELSQNLVTWQSGAPALVVVEDTPGTLVVRSATPLGSHCEFLLFY